MKKYSQFEFAKKFLYDKNIYMETFINGMLDKCYSMFEWEGLPDGMEKRDIEKYLLTYGHCIFTERGGKFYALDGNFTGLENAYHRLHEYLVTNVALGIEGATFETDGNRDCVLMENDGERMGLYPTFAKYGVMLNDCEVSLNMLSVLNRVPYMITSADGKSKASAELFLTKIRNGDFSIIADNAFLESIKSIPLPTSQSNQINAVMELTQYVKASSCNEIGLNANWNSKRERLNVNEISLNDDALLPMVENMLYCRQKAVGALNEKYGLAVSVRLAHEWEQKEQEVETSIADLKDKAEFNESAGKAETETKETETKETETKETETKETETKETGGQE